MKSQNTLHALFEKQALAHPKKIAIKDNVMTHPWRSATHQTACFDTGSSTTVFF
jgi:hypothetical protein